MAVRFRLTDPTRSWLERARRVLRRKAAITMGAVIVGFVVPLYVTKVFIAAPEHTSFTLYPPVVEEAPQQRTEHKKIDTGSPPPTPAVADVITAPVDLALTPTTFTVDASMEVSDSDSFGGLGDSDLGEGTGSGNNPGLMGSREKPQSGFSGVFFDFKKKADGKDSPLAGKLATFNGDVLALQSRFVNSQWNLNNFSGYFRPKMQLYTTCFYMPNSLDKEATNAYDPEGRYNMKKGRWAAIYRARVKAPVSGRFRFVGIADSIMAVRFDGRNVLICGHHDVEHNVWNKWNVEVHPELLTAKDRELYAYKGCEAWNAQTGGFVGGSEFTVKEGQWYEMQVLVSEIGGGEFGFCLLLDNLDEVGKKRTPEGQPLFQIFRTDLSLPNAKDAYAAIKYKEEESQVDPPYDPDSPYWEARPMAPDAKMK